MDGKSGRMEWILEIAEQYRAQICRGPFFQTLERVERPSDLRWLHQLIHQSREFTQALCLRYALCHDKRYQRIFAEHAAEEADHPDQLIAWMGKCGFLNDVEAGGIPAMRETTETLAYCWRSAVYEPPDLQIITLNVLSEGISLDFCTAVAPVLQRLDILSGSYWSTHRDADSHHLSMGLDLCGNVSSGSSTGMHYRRVLAHTASLYHQMLSSWVGKRGEPLEP